MNKGKLIVIEGACDGIGKSTQFKLLCDKLIEKGYSVINHHFPSYGTPQAEKAEKYLKGELEGQENFTPYEINKIFAYDRKVTWEEELKEAYNSGKLIVLDRYTTSSLLYQSSFIDDKALKKKFIDDVISYEFDELKIQKPDIVIFLTASFDMAYKLITNRKEVALKKDIYEEDLEFQKKVHNNSNDIAKYLSWNIVVCDKDNKMRSIEDIHNEIMEIVEKNL